MLGTQCLYYYQYPFQVLADLPAEDCAFIRYEELVDSPSKTVEALYQQIGFSMSEAFTDQLRAEDARARKHRREHVYNLEEFGLSRSEIREALPEAFERFGWDGPPAHEPEARQANGDRQ